MNKKNNAQAKVQRRLVRGLQFLFFCIIAVIMVAPMVWALSVSLQGPGLAYEMPPKLFNPPLRFDNFTTVLAKYDFFRYFLNSMFICALTMIGVVFSNSMIGFGFAKYESKGLNALFFIGLCTMYVPSVTMMVPQYVFWVKLGALDTYLPLILGSYFGSIMWIFMMRQNFKSISNAFFEAAYIDGANPIYILWKIYMPLSKPMIATLMLRTFMGSWSDMMTPLLYITTKEKYTVALAMSALGAETMGRVELELAGAIMAMVPVIIVYLFAQRYFIGGVAAAGVKG